MSREIKFRAWNNRLKVMSDYVSAIQNGDTQGTPSSVNVVVKGKQETWNIQHDDVTLEQYSGLKDKSGKKIYEGDIDLVDKDMYGKIIWKKGGFWIKWRGREKPFEEFLTPYMDDKLNIIGNIHENPELLEAIYD
ncbi:YopX family protein [Liquorilactobacillus sp.]|uniref:YopX family protein n=1 Tax=Liquorilactobacillus sp. TaxID=2767923 RepID=UPI0039E9A969